MLSEDYGEQCLSRARIFEWHKRFCGEREDVKDDDRLDCPVTLAWAIIVFNILSFSTKPFIYN